MQTEFISIEKDGRKPCESEENEETFFDAKKYPPRPGQVLARYSATAEFVTGEDKEIIVDLLSDNPVGAKMAVQFLKNKLCVTEESAIAVCKEMTQDLVRRKTKSEVVNKIYKMNIEMLFYTERKNIPDDQHWDTIPIISNHDLTKKNSQGTLCQ